MFTVSPKLELNTHHHHHHHHHHPHISFFVCEVCSFLPPLRACSLRSGSRKRQHKQQLKKAEEVWHPRGRSASNCQALPSLKLTAKAPENGWLLEDELSHLGPGLFSWIFMVGRWHVPFKIIFYFGGHLNFPGCFRLQTPPSRIEGFQSHPEQ